MGPHLQTNVMDANAKPNDGWEAKYENNGHHG
jgi:hypothetical protein